MQIQTPTPGKSLTDQQRAVIQWEQRNILVNATAGSGKTTTLAHALARVLQEGGKPHSILVLTMTNPARKVFDEKAARICAALGVRTDVKALTLHGIGGRVIGEYCKIGALPDTTLASDETMHRLVLQALNRVSETHGAFPDGLDTQTTAIAEWLQFFNMQKYTLRIADMSRDGYQDAEIADALDVPVTHIKAFRIFERLRQDAGLRSYADFVYDPVMAIADEPHLAAHLAGRYSHILVDEFHDINECQLRLLSALSGRWAKVLAVGDADQCINTWSGATPDIMRARFSALFKKAKEMSLDESFRFGPSLAAAVNDVMSKNKEWAHRDCVSHRKIDTAIDVVRYAPGEAISSTVRVIEEWRKKNDLERAAVLVREWAQTIPLELALIGAGIPYAIQGNVPFMMRTESLALRGLLHLAAGKLDAMNNREMRRRTVIAMMALPSLGVPHDRVEQAAEEVADAPALLTTFTSFAMKELAQKDPQRARMIEQTWQWLRDNLHGMSAGALLSGAADKLGLFTEISRRYLNHEKSVSARLSLKGFIDFATESGLDALTFLDHMEQLSIAYNKNSGASVRVSTCHSAKGYEWNHVIMPELKQGLFPLKGQPIPEERRVFYVGITRARNRLTLLAPEGNVPGNWQNVDAPHKMHTSGTSTFLFDIEPQNTKKKM